MSDALYKGFEDRFRGSIDEIREKQRVFVPLFAGASDVLDIGCGRGEFLALLKEHRIGARGIDTNAEMVGSARERSLAFWRYLFPDLRAHFPEAVKGLDAVPARTSPDSAISAHNAAVRMRYTSAPLHSPSCGTSNRASTICQSKNAVKTYR